MSDARDTPRKRWGTCCPDDPNCEHSFLDIDALVRHMDTPFAAAVSDETGSPE